jgi:hypothetical protein
MRSLIAFLSRLYSIHMFQLWHKLPGCFQLRNWYNDCNNMYTVSKLLVPTHVFASQILQATVSRTVKTWLISRLILSLKEMDCKTNVGPRVSSVFTPLHNKRDQLRTSGYIVGAVSCLKDIIPSVAADCWHSCFVFRRPVIDSQYEYSDIFLFSSVSLNKFWYNKTLLLHSSQFIVHSHSPIRCYITHLVEKRR